MIGGVGVIGVGKGVRTVGWGNGSIQGNKESNGYLNTRRDLKLGESNNHR